LADGVHVSKTATVREASGSCYETWGEHSTAEGYVLDAIDGDKEEL
jgi:hypothetical protein